MEECKNALRTLMLFVFYKIEKKEWSEALRLAGFEPHETFSAKRRLTNFIEHMDNHNYKLGGVLK